MFTYWCATKLPVFFSRNKKSKIPYVDDDHEPTLKFVSKVSAKKRPNSTMERPTEATATTTQNGGIGMGCQSQNRNSQQKRAYELAKNNNPRSSKRAREGGQQTTLAGEVAEVFDPLKHCKVCKARHYGLRVPKRPHSVFCEKNTMTRGRGPLNELTMETIKESRRLTRHFSAPLPPNQRGSWRHSTRENGEKFFAPRRNTAKAKGNRQNDKMIATPAVFCEKVTALVEDSTFVEKHNTKGAPLAMIAMAEAVSESITRKKNEAIFNHHFEGITMTVPSTKEQFESPHYHSIVGQKLLFVDWDRCGITVPLS